MRALDLKAPSGAAKISVSYWMPDMPDMGRSEEVALLQNDHSFSTTLFFSMSGRRQITLKITDGDDSDEYTFDLSV